MTGPREPYACIPESLLYDPNLDAVAVRVYGVLLRHGTTPDKCFPSHERIAELAGVGARSVNRVVAALEAAGWVTRVLRGRAGTAYHVHATAQHSAASTRSTAQHSAAIGTERRAESAPKGAQNRHRKARSTAHRKKASEREPVNDTPVAPTLLQVPTAPAEPDRSQPTFDDFWQVYPIRVGKRKAAEAWAKAIKRAEPREICNGAWRYARDPNRDPAYTKHPTTWLNQDCWEDDPLPARGAQQGQAGRMGRNLQAAQRFVQRMAEGGADGRVAISAGAAAPGRSLQG